MIDEGLEKAFPFIGVFMKDSLSVPSILNA
jgi:hypothetical protein